MGHTNHLDYLIMVILLLEMTQNGFRYDKKANYRQAKKSSEQLNCMIPGTFLGE